MPSVPRRGWGRFLGAAIAVCSAFSAFPASASPVPSLSSASSSTNISTTINPTDKPTQDAAEIAESLPESGFFAVKLNQQDKGEALLRVQGDSILMQESDFERLGLVAPKAGPIAVAGESFISLNSVQGLNYRLDRNQLVIELDATPESFVPQEIDLSKRILPAANGERLGGVSAYLNYGASVGTGGDSNFALEGGVAVGQTRITTAVSGTGSKVVRGLSALTIDNPKNATRLVVGDSFVSTGQFGGSAFIGGVSFSRNFQLNPNLQWQPGFGITTATASPSTVQTYVNGQLVDQRQVSPGIVKLENLPIYGQGRTDTQVVVRDAFGRTKVVSTAQYGAASLLKAGMDEFSYGAGWVREGIGEDSFGYTKPALLAFHRHGFSDNLTAGFRMEATTKLLSGGLNATINLPGQIGQLDIAGAFSQSEGKSGTAFGFGYSYGSPKFGISLNAEWISDHYASIGLNANDDRAKFTTSAIASIPVPLIKGMVFSPSFTRSSYRDRETTQDISLRLSVPLNNRTSLFARYSHITGFGKPDDQLYVGLSMVFGATPSGLDGSVKTPTVATIQATSDNAGVAATATIAKAIANVPNTFGYRLQQGIATNGAGTTGVQLQYQSSFARATLDYAQLGDNKPNFQFNVAGGIVLAGGRVFPTLPIYSSFALVRVGIPGVRVSLNNQVVGVSDKRGELLVPNLYGNNLNKITIDLRDLPINYRVVSEEKYAIPAERSGGVIDFNSFTVRSLSGSVVVKQAGKVLIPEYGDITLIGEHSDIKVQQPIGKRGAIYFDEVPPGEYQVLVDYKGNRFHGRIVVPPDRGHTEVGIDLGTIELDTT